MIIENILDTNRCKKDANGIWVSTIRDSPDVQTSKSAWEAFYNFDDLKIKSDRQRFLTQKMPAVLNILKQHVNFSKKMIYLELGCGPGYIGEYLMQNYNAVFVGIDFNYEMLLTLKRYLDKHNLTEYILIHGDIHDIPLKESTVDFIYGGGVIEHVKDTLNVILENYRVVKPFGVVFNTVPALNLFWFTRFWYSIPNISFFRIGWEYLHTKVLRDVILNKKFGYELSFKQSSLIRLYAQGGFNKIESGSYYIPPYADIIKISWIRRIINTFFNNVILTPMYFVSGRKK